MDSAEIDRWHMRRALELAAKGQGCVEPNPMVGCVIARGAEIIGEGWHRRFGGPHAEVEALRLAGERATGATAYVTLEPCCHQGKTPPCSKALLAAGVARVVVAQRDPFPQVDGGGLAELEAAGVSVSVGLLQSEARRLNAPYLMLIESGRPWVIAKWAMTLDGKIATHSGSSQWISCAASRALVHALRGRVDAVAVGRGTAAADDPLLTARPAGPRVATRIVLDTAAAVDPSSQLVCTASEAPVLVACSPEADAAAVENLQTAGCEVFACEGETATERLQSLLAELGRRRMTNLLVEGGGRLLGMLFDMQAVDEVHVFIAPKIVGGEDALGPIGGRGIEQMTDAMQLDDVHVEQVETDIYLRGRVKRESPASETT